MRTKFFLLFTAIVPLIACSTINVESNSFSFSNEKSTESAPSSTKESSLDSNNTPEIIEVKNGQLDQNVVSIYVDMLTKTVDLKTSLVISDNSSFKLYLDELGYSEIPSKIAASSSGELADGKNVFFVYVYDANGSKTSVYEIDIYRSYLVTLNYMFKDTSIHSQRIPTYFEHSVRFIPKIVGYEFVEWVDSSGESVEKVISYESDIEVYALCNPLSYLVTLDPNNGSESTEKEIVFDSNYKLDVPFLKGYSFVGWFIENKQLTDQNGNSISNWDIADEATLIAKYSANPYVLTLINDNENAGSIKGGGTYEFDSYVSVTATPKTGYSFIGWYENDELISEDRIYSFRMGESKVLKAVWNDGNKYKISLDANGGTVDVPVITVQYNHTYELPVPKKEGHEFQGWYDVNGYLFPSEGTYTKTTYIGVKAGWKQVVFRTSVEINNNEFGTVTGAGDYTVGDTVNLKATPKDGYTFLCWKSGSSNGEQISEDNSYSFEMPQKDVNLYAEFVSNEDYWNIKHGVIKSKNLNGNLTYGLYPQSYVNDEALISNLNQISEFDENGYCFYNSEYYTKVTATPAQGNREFNDGTVIVEGKEYWFKLDPIEWSYFTFYSGNGISSYTGYFSLKVLDYREFNKYGRNIYLNSPIRTWLNNDFYNQAFFLNDDALKTASVANNLQSSGYSTGVASYFTEDAKDKVFLMSVKECNFKLVHLPVATEYARAIGCAYYNSDSYINQGKTPFGTSFWLRSPYIRSTSESTDNSVFLYEWTNEGDIVRLSYWFSQYKRGIRPCIYI